MTSNAAELFPNLLNLLLCIAWGWSALCRLAAMGSNVRLHAVVLYVAVFALSVVCGLQFFFFGTLAGWVDVAASVAILAVMAASWRSWRYGVPRELCKVCR